MIMMDVATRLALAQLIRANRLAALGTLFNGQPLVSLAPYAFAPDFSAFYLHLSRLAQHTQAIHSNPAIGLMIAAPDDGQTDPQLLQRVSIRSQATLVAKSSIGYESIRAIYLTRFPNAQPMFGLGDFDLYQIEPHSARLVTGFAQAYNLELGHFKLAAGEDKV